MRILFAASENAWGGFLGQIREKLPQYEFVATGGFHIDSLQGYEVLIPTMCPVGREQRFQAKRAGRASSSGKIWLL